MLTLRRESDGAEGHTYLRVKNEFKNIEDALLAKVFANENILGLTLNQLENFDTDLEIESLGDRFSIK